MVKGTASWTQQGLTLGCYISFEAITSGGGKGTLYNLPKERDEVWMPDCCWQLDLGRLEFKGELHCLRGFTLLEVSASVEGPRVATA